jgi:hypothetical protein
VEFPRKPLYNNSYSLVFAKLHAVKHMVKQILGMVFLSNFHVTLNNKAMKTQIKTLALIFVSTLTMISCRNAEKEAQLQEEAKQRVIDSIKTEEAKIAKQRAIDSMKTIAAQQQAQQRTVVIHDRDGGTTTVKEERKGWSGAAKGAVIGAGVGAISGAVIDKKKPARGAIIGGLAGGGLGAGTGAILDAEKKKKEEANK